MHCGEVRMHLAMAAYQARHQGEATATLTDQSMRTPVGESVLSKQRETPQPQFHWRKIQTSVGKLGATEIVPSG
jgi:hypothetical protein